jgi:isoleucyl-tRNA synthetase
LHDGPPFANGKSHTGNLYNKVLKDVVNRYKLLQGYRIHYIPGFDCFGTSTEDFFLADTSLQKVKDLELSLGNQNKVQNTRELNDEERKTMNVRQVVEPGVKDSMMLQMNEL